MVGESNRSRAFRSPRNKPASAGFGPGAFPLLGLSQTQQLAKQEFARARRYGYPLTIGVCRVDRIDRLTDLYGMESRHLLLERLARLFHARSRSTDIVGRIGEDRLLWVLPHTGLDGARSAADRIRAALEEIELESGSRTIRATLSVGLACYVDRNTLFFDSILIQAEAALHRAEDRGGNRIEVHPLPYSAPDERRGGSAGASEDAGGEAGYDAGYEAGHEAGFEAGRDASDARGPAGG